MTPRGIIRRESLRSDRVSQHPRLRADRSESKLLIPRIKRLAGNWCPVPFSCGSSLPEVDLALIEINITNATATVSEHVWDGRLFNCITYAEVNSSRFSPDLVAPHCLTL